MSVATECWRVLGPCSFPGTLGLLRKQVRAGGPNSERGALLTWQLAECWVTVPLWVGRAAPSARPGSSLSPGCGSALPDPQSEGPVLGVLSALTTLKKKCACIYYEITR